MNGAVTVRLPGDRPCTETGALCTLTGQRLSEDVTLTLETRDPPLTISISDTSAAETDGLLRFEITLSKRAKRAVEAWVRPTDRGTATEGVDFRSSGEVMAVFPPGKPSYVVGVMLLDDTVDDDGETVIMEIVQANEVSMQSNWSRPVAIAKREATGTIRNSDLMPGAWMARFGREVAGQVIEAVESRMQAPRASGAEVSLAGQGIGLGSVLGGDHAGAGEDLHDEEGRLADWLAGDAAGSRFGQAGRYGLHARTVTADELLLGSSFSLTAAAEGAPGGTVSLWGRAAAARCRRR